MHGGNGHRHHHHHDHDHDHDHDHHHAPGRGHNAPSNVAQWQTPHLPESEKQSGQPERDLDLVETAFVKGFAEADDPTSFLRLAKIPFEALAPDGARLVLLRVETDQTVDIGSVTPHLGGESFRYDVLPARMVSKRQYLCFVYSDGNALRRLGLADARALPEA
jgi:hypothetical protein